MTTAATVRHWFGVPEHTTSLRDRLVAAVAAVGTTTTSWLYPLTPVLLNAPRAHKGDPAPPAPVFTAEQLQVALAEIDIIADMSDEGLQIVYQAILRRSEMNPNSGEPSCGPYCDATLAASCRNPPCPTTRQYRAGPGQGRTASSR